MTFEVEPAITVDDVLRLPVLRDGVPEILAGHDQLGRQIRWIHSGEFPDMPSVLKGGELLLSHGMSIPSRPANQRRYIADLARAGIAGLVIELSPTLTGLPPELLQEARAHDVPLVALHRPIPWVEVTETIHRAIVRRQDGLVQRGHELQQRLVAQLAAGAGAAEVLGELADSLGNPVLLTRDGAPIYSAARGVGEAAVASAWDATVRGLRDAPALLSAPVAVGADAGWGQASVLGLERELDRFDPIALEGAVPILALALQRAHELEILAARERGHFLEALLERRDPLEEPWAHRHAATAGFAGRSSWLLPLAAGAGADQGNAEASRWALAAHRVREELASRGTPAVVGTLRHADAPLALVIGLGSTEHRQRMADAVAETIRRAIRGADGEADVVLCAGRSVATWREARDTLRETVEAVPAMRHAPPQAWYDLRVPQLRQLLWALHDAPPVVEFTTRRLAPLTAHDTRRGTQLVATLAAYCACRGRKTEAARLLHLERQSLYKRLSRIETLLGADLEDEDTLLGLHLALRAREMIPPPQGVASGLA